MTHDIRGGENRGRATTDPFWGFKKMPVSRSDAQRNLEAWQAAHHPKSDKALSTSHAVAEAALKALRSEERFSYIWGAIDPKGMTKALLIGRETAERLVVDHLVAAPKCANAATFLHANMEELAFKKDARRSPPSGPESA